MTRLLLPLLLFFAALPAHALTPDEENTIAVFERTSPATVYVSQHQRVRDWSTRQIREVEAGTGSGFLWNTQGHIVTNWHVVDGGSRFVVTFSDGSEHEAELVGGESRKDIAVLKIKPAGRTLTAVRLPAKNAQLRVGQKTIAIGNPFGLDQTLTTGIVSALDREIPGYGGVRIRGMVQTDAAINPGNSGGPLLDSDGRLMGMNTMIYSESGSSAGIGFAVPVSTLRKVVPQIIATGSARQVGLGVSLVDDALVRRAGIKGVVIDQVIPGGPAAKAGLRGLTQGRRGALPGDIIVGIGKEDVRNYDDLYTLLDAHEPGDVVAVRLRNSDRVRTVRISLAVLK
jgi:S1-C subfamily serine protease